MIASNRSNLSLGSRSTGTSSVTRIAKPIDGNATPKAQTCCTEKKPKEGFVARTFEDPVAAYTLLLAIITGLLCYATWRLYRTTVQLATEAKETSTDQANKMERSIEQATRAAHAMEKLAESNAANSAEIAESVKLNRLAMRARISVVIGDAVYQEPGSLKFEGKPKILNRGATEARDVRWKIAAAILPTPIPEDFKFSLPKESIGGTVIGSQGDGNVSAIVEERVADKEVEAIKSGHPKGLVVWGFVAYRDIFGKRHLTTFCHLMYWKQVAKKRAFRAKPEAPFGYYLPMHNRSN